jgi:YfiH family protein
VKPPASKSSTHPETQEIDALFERAGLVRNLRGKTGVPSDGPLPPGRKAATRRMRFERAAPEELSRQSAAPRVALNGVHWLTAPGWQQLPWLWHGFSTRRAGLSRAYCADDAPGELNLGFTAADSREAVAANRRLLAEAVTGDAATPLITLQQIHSTLIRTVGKADAEREKPHQGDGFMTDEPGVLLGVQTADCIPVLVADRKRRAVAAFHAGWRGTVERIVETGIGRMRLTFGSRPEDLVAAIGPGIGQCCYAVGEEVFSSFESQFAYFMDMFREVYDSDPVRQKYPMLFLTQRAPGHSPIGPSLHLDLVEANRRQLLAAGLKPRAIKLAGGCTSCQRELYFSHRASQGHAGRMLSVIGIQKGVSRK